MSPPTGSKTADPFNLDRFVSAQEGIFGRALAELREGRKRTHWMWFVFPQVQGLGHSRMSRDYALRNLEEAQAYLNHPVLGPRLLECCRAILALQGVSAATLFGQPDDLKLRSSVTLFHLAAPSVPEFASVLQQYFSGQSDPRTIALLSAQE